MLLTPSHARKRLRRERQILGGLLIGLIVLLLGVFIKKPVTLAAPAPGRIACDAERVRGQHFVNGDFQFEGASFQSREQARSGNHSLQLPALEETVYGFNTQVEGVLPGEVYEVSIWRWGDAAGIGKLTVQGQKPNGIYLETNEPVSTDAKGWSLLQLRFHIPFQNPPTQLAVYVYATGETPVFFDDLLIEKVDQWAASTFRPTQLHLNIEASEMLKLEQKREGALAKGLLQSADDDWVDGEIVDSSDLQLSVKLRLKGDWLDHLRGDKWSFRVKVKDPHAWRQLKEFSLHTPAARYYLHEWLLHQLWEQEDVLTTRYDFVELVINGTSRGIYAYEEHFEKQLLESRARREGPILRLSEEGYWGGVGRQLQHHGFIRPGGGYSAMTPANADIEAFNAASLAEDSIQSAHIRQASLLLEQFRSGRQPPAAIFDLARLADYYAACDVLNAYHGIVWHNQRFYYNPVNGRLEPIGFDGFGEAPPPRYDLLINGALQPERRESESLYGLLIQDTSFIRHYIKALNRLSEPTFWNQFQQNLEEDWTARLNWLQMEFPNYQPDLAEIAKEVAFVRSHLFPFADHSVKTYRNKQGRVLARNVHNFPLTVIGYGGSPDFIREEWDNPIWLPGQATRQLWARSQTPAGAVSFQSIQFIEQQALAEQHIPQLMDLPIPSSARYLFYQLPGVDTTFSSLIQNDPLPKGLADVQRQARTPSQADDFPRLRWTEQAVIIPGGEHAFQQDLIIPTGFTLIIEAGATIDLQTQSAIISYGPVRALGQEEQPIIIRSSDGTGEGLQVLEAPTASVLQGVLFDGLRNIRRGDWQLTGAVTFYESSVQITDCLWQDNQSEDALNIIRSEFTITNTVIRRTSSDGLDSDYCKGTIMNSRFENTTNDGVDFSGSIVTIDQSQFKHCGDKGISVGEESDVAVFNSRIEDCPIALASKDLSVILVRDLTLMNCLQGFVAFQKKPEYGPARILVERYTATGVDRLYEIAPGSRLQLEQQIVE